MCHGQCQLRLGTIISAVSLRLELPGQWPLPSSFYVVHRLASMCSVSNYHLAVFVTPSLRLYQLWRVLSATCRALTSSTCILLVSSPRLAMFPIVRTIPEPAASSSEPRAGHAESRDFQDTLIELHLRARLHHLRATALDSTASCSLHLQQFE